MRKRKRKGEFKMETKICTKCKRELSLDNFRWKNKAEGKKHSQCKECQSKQEKNSLSSKERSYNSTNTICKRKKYRIYKSTKIL